MVCCLVFAVCNVLFALFLLVVVVVVEISFFFSQGNNQNTKSWRLQTWTPCSDSVVWGPAVIPLEG